MDLLRGLDLFSGIGGIIYALSEWVRPIAYCEIDPYCQSVLLSRMQEGDLPKAPIWDDATCLDKACLDEILCLQQEADDMAGKLKKLTEEQVEQAKEGYLQGMSLSDLGHIYGVTRQAMWDLLRRRIKLRQGKDNTKKEFSEQQINKMILMYENGKSLDEIAKVFKSSSGTISKNLDGKISLRSNKRFGAENHFYRGGARADQRAWDILQNEIRYGRIINPGKCETCGDESKFKDGRTAIQGHHDDYNKPLSVRWLCQKCHFEWHRHNKPTEYKGDAAEPCDESKIDIITAGFP